MYFYSGAIVKVPELGSVRVQFIWLHDFCVDVLLDKNSSNDDAEWTYVYHVDYDFLEKYREGPYYVDEVIETEWVDKSGESATRRRPTKWRHGIDVVNLMIKEAVQSLPPELNSIIESIITQPKLKAEDIIKELSFLEYDLAYKPVRLSASKGWKAKRVVDNEIVSFDQFVFDLLDLLKGKPEER